MNKKKKREDIQKIKGNFRKKLVRFVRELEDEEIEWLKRFILDCIVSRDESNTSNKYVNFKKSLENFVIYLEKIYNFIKDFKNRRNNER